MKKFILRALVGLLAVVLGATDLWAGCQQPAGGQVRVIERVTTYDAPAIPAAAGGCGYATGQPAGDGVQVIERVQVRDVTPAPVYVRTRTVFVDRSAGYYGNGFNQFSASAYGGGFSQGRFGRRGFGSRGAGGGGGDSQSGLVNIKALNFGRGANAGGDSQRGLVNLKAFNIGN